MPLRLTSIPSASSPCVLLAVAADLPVDVDQAAGVDDEVGRVEDAALGQLVRQRARRRAGCWRSRRRSRSAAGAGWPRRSRRPGRRGRGCRTRPRSAFGGLDPFGPELRGQPRASRCRCRRPRASRRAPPAAGPASRRRGPSRRSRSGARTGRGEPKRSRAQARIAASTPMRGERARIAGAAVVGRQAGRRGSVRSPIATRSGGDDADVLRGDVAPVERLDEVAEVQQQRRAARGRSAGSLRERRSRPCRRRGRARPRPPCRSCPAPAAARRGRRRSVAA